MRTCACLLVLAAAAAAAPRVRWIDATGECRDDAVQEVVSEAIDAVVVRLEDGAEITIPGRSLLDLVRERDEEPDQRALLAARRAAEWGWGDLDEARGVLDRLSEDADDWMREYARAARAMLASRSGDADAAERIDAFVEEYPTSRFLAPLELARARAAWRGGPPADGEQPPFGKAYDRIGELGGPRIHQAQALLESVRRALDPSSGWQDAAMALITIDGQLGDIIGSTRELDWRLVAESARFWFGIERALVKRREAKAVGAPPVAARNALSRICDRMTGLLPELRSDAHREYGVVLLECGDPEAAVAQLEAARDVAPDPMRRASAEKALALAKAARGAQR